MIQLTSGLDDGDVVVIRGAERLRSGQKVAVVAGPGDAQAGSPSAGN
jgi:hypothetical protein